MSFRLKIPYPEFIWTSQAEPEQQNIIEREIYEIIQDQRDDVWPCHPDAMVVFLGISGPLDRNLKGVVKCKKCDKKTLMEFEGDDRASNLKLTIYK